MSTVIRLAPEYFPDPQKGRPISSGSIYVGVVDLDPEITGNQIQVSARQENGTTVTIPQPIETGAGGVPLYNGSPVSLIVESAYSLKVLNSSGTQIYYVPNNFGVEPNDSYVYLSEYDCDLSTALASIGSVTKTTLVVNCDAVLASGTTETVTSNICLKIINGSSIDGVVGGSTETLIINGPLVSGTYKIFGQNLTVYGTDTTLLDNGVKADWFISEKGNQSIDNSDDIHRARDFVHSMGGNEVIFGNGIYYANIIFRKWVLFRGAFGSDTTGTVIKPYDTTKPVFRSPVTDDFDNPDAENPYHTVRFGIRDLSISGRYDEGANTVTGIYISPQAETWADEPILHRLRITACNTGIYLHGLNPLDAGADTSFTQSLNMSQVNVVQDSGTSYALHVEGIVIESNIVSCKFLGTNAPAVYINATSTGTGTITTPARLHFESSVLKRAGASGACVTVDGVRGLSFDTCYFENSTTSLILSNTDTNENVTVDTCQFTNYSDSGVYGLGAEGLIVINSEFDPSGSTSEPAINLQDASAIGDIIDVDIRANNYSTEHTGTVVKYKGIPTLASSATPNVLGSKIWYLPNDGTEITGFVNPEELMPYTFIAASPTTPNYLLATGEFETLSAPFHPNTNGDSITLMYFGTAWRELSRAVEKVTLTYTTVGASQTVDISGYYTVYFNQASASSISDFTGKASEYSNRTIIVMASNGSTKINNSANINTLSGADTTLTANTPYSFISIAGVWFEER